MNYVHWSKGTWSTGWFPSLTDWKSPVQYFFPSLALEHKQRLEWIIRALFPFQDLQRPRGLRHLPVYLSLQKTYPAPTSPTIYEVTFWPKLRDYQSRPWYRSELKFAFPPVTKEEALEVLENERKGRPIYGLPKSSWLYLLNPTKKYHGFYSNHF